MANERYRTKEQPVHLSAEEARGGEIVLRTRRRRWIFAGGLIALAVLALAAG